MRALSIIGMILSILIILICFLGYVAAYSQYRNAVYDDFGDYGGYIRHFDSKPYILGGGFGLALLIGSIIGMAASKKKPQPVVNVYNQQPHYQQPQQFHHHQPQHHHQQYTHQPQKQPPQYPTVNATVQQPPSAQNPIAGMDITSQLEKLGKLKEQGLLSDQEFADAKRKLLG